MDDRNSFEDDFLLENDEDFLPLTPSNEEEKKEDSKSTSENIISIDSIINEPISNPVVPEEEIVNQNIEPTTIINEENNNQPEINNIVEPLPIKEDENQNIEPTTLVNEENNSQSKINDIKIEEEKPKQPRNNNIKMFIYNNAKVLPVIAFLFVSVLGIYIFIHNVNADIINLIKIEEKEKVGYINNEGNVVVKPKYLYGSDYYKGYAIVKNYNNLYGIIDGKGNNEISFGNIFSANLYGNRYIVSKFTNEGLKMGLLDSNLKEVTRIKYDNLAYSKAGIFMYTYNDTMGIMNNSGKEIYSYKVDEIDDKNISVEVSNLDDKNSNDRYAKVKINSSSTIINIETGEEVYKYTLDDIRVLDNNVFYIKNEEGNNKYFIIKNNKVIYQTDAYKRIRVEDVNSDIAIAIKDDASIDYINLITKEKINQDGSVKYTYSDGVVLQEMYKFQSGKNEFTVITPKKNLGTFADVDLTSDEYVNGYIKINTENEKYNFINKKGNILSDKEYDDASDFNVNGFSIVSNDNSYGVIDQNGKEIIDLKYDGIKFLDDTLFKNLQDQIGEQLFIFKDNNKYGIINSNGKVVVKPIYDEFKTVTTKYPIIKSKYKDDYILINLKSYKALSIDSNNDIQVYEDYIISNGQYYNYDGELIYTVGENDEK